MKFIKYGCLKFIGHLDVMRFFQKAIRRADIDITYTTGYSPHQVMSFAAPLGVGLESNGEYMDIEVNSITNSKQFLEALNGACPEGIEIVSVKLLPENAGNAMASVAAAEYTIQFREGREPKFDYKNKLAEFYAKEAILVTKETKKSTIEIDIKPGIYELDLKNDAIHMLVDASSSGNIKPTLVLNALFASYGDEPVENAFLITREDTYLNLGDSTHPNLVPMDAIGSEY